MRTYRIPSRYRLLVCGEYVIENEARYIQSENFNFCQKKMRAHKGIWNVISRTVTEVVRVRDGIPVRSQHNALMSGSRLLHERAGSYVKSVSSIGMD